MNHELTDELTCDFDAACDLDGWNGYLANETAQKKIEEFRRRCQQFPAAVAAGADRAEPRIPKIIHQIWMGSEMPRKFRRQTATWKQHHPDWEYRLWGDNDISEFSPDIVGLVNSVDCFAQKGDILRMAILQRYGGLYVDVDYDCYRPCDLLNQSFDFYTTIRSLPLLHMQFPDTFPVPLDVCTSFIGSVPSHPILNHYLERVGDRLNDEELIGKPSRLPFWGAINKMRRALKTTFNLYLEMYSEYSGMDGSLDIALPPTLLNPIDTWWRTRYYRPAYYRHLLPFLLSRTFKSKAYKFTRVQPYSFGHHDSHATWL